MGGMIPAIERGFPQTEIARASYEYQRTVQQGESVIVGVNKFTEAEEQPLEVLEIDERAERRQIERLRDLRARRSQAEVEHTLTELKRCAESSDNTMPKILDAVRAYATVGEICGALKDVFGSYTEKTVL